MGHQRTTISFGRSLVRHSVAARLATGTLSIQPPDHTDYANRENKGINKDKACGEMFHRRLCQSQLIANCGLVTGAVFATAATAAILAWFGFVDVQRPSAQILAVELLDSSSAFFLR